MQNLKEIPALIFKLLKCRMSRFNYNKILERIGKRTHQKWHSYQRMYKCHTKVIIQERQN